MINANFSVTLATLFLGILLFAASPSMAQQPAGAAEVGNDYSGTAEVLQFFKSNHQCQATATSSTAFYTALGFTINAVQVAGKNVRLKNYLGRSYDLRTYCDYSALIIDLRLHHESDGLTQTVRATCGETRDNTYCD